MANNKRLYFIPIIAKALESDDQEQAMREAFDKVEVLGSKPEYEEGYRQFQQFVKAALDACKDAPESKLEFMRNAIHRLIYDLAVGTFEGDEEQRKTLIDSLKSIPEWGAEYERTKREAMDFLPTHEALEIEIIRGDKVISSFAHPTTPTTVSAVRPGTYILRFSNGRVIWEGNFSREDLVWTFAFPGEEFPMAAKTEPHKAKPTKTMSLLDGELVMQVFAGLESGKLVLLSEKQERRK
jgi:hypothetical protein